MLEFFKRGQAARDVRLMAAQGIVEAPAAELLSILVLLTSDTDDEIRRTAGETLGRLPIDAIRVYLASPIVTDEVRAWFQQREAAAHAPAPVADLAAAAPANGTDGANGTNGGENAAPSDDAIDPDLLDDDGKTDRDSILQKLTKMSFSERLKAANKGSREVRAILIRDPSKMIAMAVLTSPKLTEQEVEAFARMGNVSEDVLRYIGSKRQWMKNYGVVLALVKNSKTPLGLSLNIMNRLNDRDLQGLSTDRNVPEPLRVAARKKVVSSVSR